MENEGEREEERRGEKGRKGKGSPVPINFLSPSLLPYHPLRGTEVREQEVLGFEIEREKERERKRG